MDTDSRVKTIDKVINAIETGNPRALKSALEDAAIIEFDALSKDRPVYVGGEPALIAAVKSPRNAKQLVKVLLDHRAGANIADFDKKTTPLIEAVKLASPNGRKTSDNKSEREEAYEIAKLLLENSAHPNDTGDHPKRLTALHHAARNDALLERQPDGLLRVNRKVYDLLKQHGANDSIDCRKSLTPLEMLNLAHDKAASSIELNFSVTKNPTAFSEREAKPKAHSQRAAEREELLPKKGNWRG